MTYVSPKLRPAMIDALIDERDGLRAELDALRIELNCAELAAEAEAEESDRLHDELKRMKQTDPIKDEREAFREWFEGEQGVAYDGMWSFAKAAWMARAALGAPSVPDSIIADAARYQFLRNGGAYLEPNEYTIYMATDYGAKYYKDLRDLDMDIDEALAAAAPEAKP